MGVWVRGALAALQEYDLALTLGEDPTKSPFKVASQSSAPLGPDTPGLEDWWKGKEARLRLDGRITDDGFIRVAYGAITPPWTISSIKKLWPTLGWGGAVALLIKCNGVLTENDMDAREMVVEVVREVVKQEMVEMFGTLLQGLRAGTLELESKAGAAPAGKGAKVKRVAGKNNCGNCGNCGEPGHRKTTCQKEKKADPE